MSDLQNVIHAGRLVSLPDAGDRTKNDPVYLMNSFDVLKLMRQHGEYYSVEGAKDYTKAAINKDNVKTIIDAALASGWLKVDLIGKQLLFTSPVINLAG